MVLVDFGCRDRHRRVDEDRQRGRQFALVDALTQEIKDLLGSIERECRNEDIAPTGDRRHDGLVKFRHGFGKWPVQPISVCRFHDDEFRAAWCFRRTQQGTAGIADIS